MEQEIEFDNIKDELKFKGVKFVNCVGSPHGDYDGLKTIEDFDMFNFQVTSIEGDTAIALWLD